MSTSSPFFNHRPYPLLPPPPPFPTLYSRPHTCSPRHTNSEGKDIRGEGEEVGTRLLKAHSAYILKCKISLDGRMLATASSDHTVKLWDPSDLTKAPKVLANHQRWVWDCAFSADSSYMVTGALWVGESERGVGRGGVDGRGGGLGRGE